MASRGARPSDVERRLSNPLDTVSLLEIGLYLRITFQRFQGLAGILDSYSFLQEEHPPNALKTIEFAGLVTLKLSHSLSVPFVLAVRFSLSS